MPVVRSVGLDPTPLHFRSGASCTQRVEAEGAK